MAATDLLLGVDGGGTKTVARLVRADVPESILGCATAGPSNIRVLGTKTALANLNAAINAAFADAGIERSRVASACLGMAGVDRDAERRAVEQWAANCELTERIQVVHDAMPVLYAATPDGCGIAVISGTGSFAFGRNSDGVSKRCGGWGPLFGDEGSGYAIALAGLQAAAHRADGRESTTKLLNLFLTHLDLRQPSELISTIYSDGFDRKAIANLAEVVFAAYDQDDIVARNIIHQSADELANHVVTLMVELELKDVQIPLGITGGVLLNRSEVRNSMLLRLEQRDYCVVPVTVPDAVAGAITIARRALSKSLNP